IQRRICTISGDPHYYTFDGAVFHFQGTCTYILSEQCGDGQPYYRVEGSNEHRGSTHVSWTRLVKVFVYNETIELVKGRLVSSDVVFANSWKAPGEDDDGCGTGCGGLGCASCTDAQTALYGNSDHCGILQNSSGPFAACHEELPPQNFMESCVFDLCFGRGYQPILCQALSAYASQCQQNGVQLPSWRRQGFCEIPCPANSHFESQGTGCPATCVNPNSTQNCPLPAQESCICNSGYILSGGNCVPHAQCGCSFEGNYYHSGETVILDQDCGRQCNCSYGSMSCQPYGCGPLESCRLEEGERGCRPNSFGTCWIRGPGSYQTFDGLTYQYPGACQLTLAKVMGIVQVSQRSTSLMSVDGQLIRLPFTSANSGIQIYHSSIHSIILRTSFGVTVQTVWPHFVRITAPVVYNSSIGGLCGNFNGHPHDDFRTPNGILVNSSQAFGDSWRDGSLSAHCVETMDHNNETNFNTTEHCGLLALSGGPFSACWDRVNPWQQVDVCVEILRSSANPASALCEVFRDYALMCQQKGVTLGHWRNATGCGKMFLPFASDSCPSTCPSLSFPFSCNTPCQEGCQCNDGFVLNGNQCVPPTGCGCHHQGRYRQGGEQFWVGDECQSLCSCNGITGLVHCVPNSCGAQESCRVVGGEYGCHPSPHGTCSASGDPHYLTFDRNAYDFQGTCRYVLATLCNDTTGLHQFSVEARNEAWRGLPVSITAEVFVNVWGYRVHMSRQNHGYSVNHRTFKLQVSALLILIWIRIIFLMYFIKFPITYNLIHKSEYLSNHFLKHSGRTCGLCGNFNGNRNDDFMTPSEVVVTSPSEFGTAWKVEGNYSCSDGCGTSCPQCTNDQPARAQCEVITAADGPLSFCHQQVDPTPYFNDCVYDFCVSENQGYDLVCRSIQAYVSAFFGTLICVFGPL
uniref:VWFD domain-containing protein n=1 Tax=Sphaeramia orbicularis TaxID=375764 RepID=A0A673C3R4_9TELE